MSAAASLQPRAVNRKILRSDAGSGASPRRWLRRLFHLRVALQRAAADAGVRARIRALAGGGQPVAVGADRGAGVGDHRRGRGRRRLLPQAAMAASLAASSLATAARRAGARLADAARLRALAGLALSGLPAVAMAYLGDEMDAEAIGLAMGLYIAGSTLGGMSGRLVVAALSDPSAGGPRSRRRARSASPARRRSAPRCRARGDFRRAGRTSPA